MEYFLFVAVVYAFEELVGEAFDDERVHTFLFGEVAHKFLKVVFQILENEDKLAIRMDDFP